MSDPRNHGGYCKYTDEELLADVRRVAEKTGQYPSQSLYDEHGRAFSGTLVNRFGSWVDVVERAGLASCIEDDRGHFEASVSRGLAAKLVDPDPDGALDRGGRP